MKWWGSVWAMEMRKILAYRSDFWATFLGQTLIQLLIGRALWQSIFQAQGVKSMQGLDLDTLTLYYLIVPLGARILTGENIGFISREIYDGTLTRYLLYPLSFFQYKFITYLTHSLFYGVQLIFIYSLFHFFFHSWVNWNGVNLLSGVLIFFMASICYLLMATALELIALWAENIWSLLVMLRFFNSFFGGGYVPLDFFPMWAQELLHWTPFPYLVNLPVKVTMGMASGEMVLRGGFILFGWILFFTCIVKLIWTRGQKQYAGVGI